jgi:hypothetical protein
MYPHWGTPYHVGKLLSLRFMPWALMLSSHLCINPPHGLFPSGFLSYILYIFLSDPVCYMSAHLILFHLITLVIFGEKYKP